VQCSALSLGFFPRPPDETAPVESVVAAQRRAGIESVVDGQRGWTGGLAHPLLSATGVTPGAPRPGLPGTAGGPTPIVEAPLEAGPVLGTELAVLADLATAPVMVLPGPYTLATVADDRYYDDPAALLAAVAALLAAEVAAAPPMDTIVVHEPRLATRPPAEDLVARVPTALETVLAATAARSVVVPYGGVLTDRVHAHVLDADIDVLGYDLLADHDAAVDLVAEYGSTDAVALCVLDPTSRTSTSTVADRVDWFRATVPDVVAFDAAILCPDRGLREVAPTRVETVLTALAAAATRD